MTSLTQPLFDQISRKIYLNENVDSLQHEPTRRFPKSDLNKEFEGCTEV